MLYTVCGSVIRSKPLPALAGRGVGCGQWFISALNTLILTAGFVWGDRYRRKNFANQKKINEYLKNKENNGF